MKNIYFFFAMLIGMHTFAQIDEQFFNGTKQFANAVAVDGGWAVVGNMWQVGHFQGSDYPNAGMISIYKVLPNGNWEHYQDIDEPNYFAYNNNPASPIGMYYGCSVDISGDNIIVGAYAYDSDMEGDIGPDGMAFIYSYDAGSNLFLKVASLSPEVRVENEFGWSVAISGDWAVVGDPSEQHSLVGGGPDRENIGCAHVYRYETGVWIYKTKLTASNGWGGAPGGGVGGGDNFGYAVDLEGDVVVVGAPNRGVENGHAIGASYIYEWDGFNWSETMLQAMVSEDYSKFGAAVSVLGDHLVVGAPGPNGGSIIGNVNLFQKNAGVWANAGTQYSSDGVAGDMFGFSLDLNLTHLAVGAYGFDSETGKTYIYEYTNGMIETSLQSSDIALSDEFGYACALSDDYLLIGAHKTERDIVDPVKEGTVYIYSMAMAFGGEWSGAVSTNWGDPNNWVDINVPNGATDVIIDALAANQPLISNMIANCRNLTIEAGATVSLGVDGNLNVRGDLNNSGQLLNLAKSTNESSFVTVSGATVFNGAGRQDIPSGFYEEFTFDAGADSYLTGDVTFNNNLHFDSHDDLFVEDNTLTIGGLLFGNENHIVYNELSNLIIINDRVIRLEIYFNFEHLHNLTINVPGNHGVAFDGIVEIHNQLNLIDGDLNIGNGASGGVLKLHQNINIVNGRLLPHVSGGDSELDILEETKNKSVFHIPSDLNNLDMLYIVRSGSTVLDGDLNIESLFLLSSAGFSANGHQITYGPDAELWISGDAGISSDMITGPNGIENIEVLSGSPTLDFDGIVQGDFNIGAGAGQVQIAAGRCISVSGSTTINAGLILKSDASGTACFIDNGPIVYGAKGSGGISVERYIPSKDEWHYVSTPVKNSTAQFFAGSYLNSYDTENSAWVAFSSLDQAVNTMQGYSNKLPVGFNGQTITFSGELNTARTSALSINLTNGGDSYNLVGNPFPSVIDWDNVNWTKTNVANALYIWNSSTGSYSSYVAGVGVNNGSRFIAPMQGFFVEATGANPSLQIDNNSVRVDQATDFLKNEDEIQNLLRLQISNSDFQDEIVIRFDESASEEFDEQFDARKMFGKKDVPQLFSVNLANEELSINTLKSVKLTDIIKLGVKAENAGNYTIYASNLKSFSEFVSIILEDRLTGQFINLRVQPSYSFSHIGGAVENRFFLHFKDYTEINELEVSEAFAYSSFGNLYITIDKNENYNQLAIYNMNGQLVKHVEIVSSSLITINIQDLAKGVFIVQLISETNTQQQKIIIE